MTTESAGIFLVNKDNKILIAHPTGGGYEWTIPKGRIEEDEVPIQAAVRETWEETNFVVAVGDEDFISHSLERIKYRGRSKYLHSFVILETENPQIDFSQQLECNSFLPTSKRWNSGKPEVDQFRWVTFDVAKGMLHPLQAGCVNRVMEIAE